MSEFATNRKRNTSFIVKNIDRNQRAVKIFGTKIGYLNQVDILEKPGIGIDDIKTSLLRGELSEKLRANIIEIVFSDLEDNADQIEFLAEEEAVTQWQDQLIWYLDAINGNDVNIGTSPTAAIKTFAEFQRRLDGEIAASQLILNILSDVTENVYLNVNVRYNLNISLTIQGSKTSLFSGSITSVTQWDSVIERDGYFSCSSLPVSWTASGLVGKQVELTSGINSGAKGWIAKDLGSKTARFSSFTDENGVNNVDPNTGNNFTIYSLPVITGNFYINHGSGNGITLKDLEFIQNESGAESITVFGNTVNLDNCLINSFTVSLSSKYTNLYNCRIVTDILYLNKVVNTYNGLCEGTIFVYRSGSLIHNLNFLFQGTSAKLASYGLIYQNSDTSWISFLEANNPITINAEGIFNILGKAWGTGSGVGFLVHGTGSILYNETQLPNYITADSFAIVGDFEITQNDLPYINLKNDAKITTENGTGLSIFDIENGLFSAAGDLDGYNNLQTVIGLQNRPLSSSAPGDGYTIVWNDNTSQWEPQRSGIVIDSQFGRRILSGTGFAGNQINLKYLGSNLSFEDNKSYDISIRIVVTNTNKTERASFIFDVLAHQDGGFLVLDVVNNTLSNLNGTGWSATIDYTSNELLVTIDAAGTDTRKALATVEWREVEVLNNEVPLLTFIFDGDSITSGQGIPEHFGSLVVTPFGVPEVNEGTSGHTLSQINAGIPSIAIPGTRAIYHLLGGINDIAIFHETDPSVILSRIQTCINSARARFENCVVVVGTILPSTFTTTPENACRLSVNSQLLAGVTTADLIVDYASEPHLTNPADLHYYGDGTHPTVLGHEWMAYRCYETLRDSGITGLPEPATELTHIRDLSSCLMELHADSGISLSGSNVQSWADQTTNGHNMVKGSLVAPIFVNNFGDSYPSLTFGGAATTGLSHEYSSNPGVTHVTNTSAAYTRVLLFNIPGASDGFLQTFAGAVTDSLMRERSINLQITQDVLDESATHGGAVNVVPLEDYGLWTTTFDGIDNSANFVLQRDTKQTVSASLASFSFGPSSPDRYSLGIWQSGGGAAGAKISSIRSAALFNRALTDLEKWQVRYFLRRIKWI